MASSSSALLYQLDQAQLERSRYRNAPDIKQRLTECERELLEWKERALQAEARLANIEAAIRLPSLPPRRDTPETRAATAPTPFAQLPTPIEQSPREAEERESVDRPKPTRNSQLRTPPAEAHPYDSRPTPETVQTPTAFPLALSDHATPEYECIAGPSRETTSPPEAARLFDVEEEKAQAESPHLQADPGDISSLTELSSEDEDASPTPKLEDEVALPRKRSASIALQGGRFLKRPRQQRPLQFDFVEIPPPPPALRRALLNERRLTTYKNPIPTVLASIAAFPSPTDLPPVPRVTRRFLCALYGSAENSLRGRITTKPYTHSRVQTGPDGQFLSATFANIDMNPHMCARPGAPGVLLTRRTDVLFDAPTPVFVGRVAGEWEYVGQYVSEVGRALRAEEFCEMPEEVQRRWATGITTMSRTKCWRDMRATVFGDEKDRQNDPEAEEVMLNALKTGVVNLKVIVFTCKGYNTDIARDILEWWPRREELEGLYRKHQKAEEQAKATSANKKGKQPSVKRRKPTAKNKAQTPFDPPHTPRKKPRLVSPAKGQGPDEAGPSSSRTEVITPSRRTPSQRRQKTPPWVRQGYGPPIDNNDDDSDYKP
ncbi:uncharacterized protein SCHCODRAFT_02630964 [Schizophyllum commune H4-8]|nr:uncharacterized protein SCHCODRAFT_02630964 [Schizophyllum commune H4-8]KAI5890138.1 hypothetical protein SCHCODRAFT_02630964 [Schizophyllum commune H4-8]